VNLTSTFPVRILRAGQFREFVDTLVGWGRKGDVSYLPKMRTQLVAARTVAEALADLATDSGPITATSNAPIPEIAGPKEENLVDAARRLVTRRSDSLRIEGVSNPADPATALYESGALLNHRGQRLPGPTELGGSTSSPGCTPSSHTQGSNSRSLESARFASLQGP
jgi:hypothetical protein